MIERIDGKIFLALRNHTDTFAGADVFYSPSVPQQPGKSEPYIVIDDVRSDFATRYVGVSEDDEYRGVWNLSVMVPVVWTSAQAIGLASDVCDHFTKGAWYAYDGARVQIMRRPKVVSAGYQDHGMIRYPVQVMWRAVG